MARPIDADALMETIRAREYPLTDDPLSTYYGLSTDGIQQAVDEQPTVSTDDVRGVGKWILVDGIDEQAMARVHYIYCSKCGRQGLETRRGNDCRSNYCPHCGAKMEVNEDA